MGKVWVHDERGAGEYATAVEVADYSGLTVRQVESSSDIRRNGELYCVEDAVKVAYSLRKAKRERKKTQLAAKKFESEKEELCRFFYRNYFSDPFGRVPRLDEDCLEAIDGLASELVTKARQLCSEVLEVASIQLEQRKAIEAAQAADEVRRVARRQRAALRKAQQEAEPYVPTDADFDAMASDRVHWIQARRANDASQDALDTAKLRAELLAYPSIAAE
jgi:hypothetical protein